MPQTKRRKLASDDAQEAAALAAASDFLPGVIPNGERLNIATRVISAWITERSFMAAKARTGTIAFDLKHAKLRGVYTAILPQIGEALEGLPADVPFFDLTKDQILDVCVAIALAGKEAIASMLEGPDDEIPF